MKIGIVTIIDYYNYGNRLQNYAVSHVLQKYFHCKVVTLEAYSERHPTDGRLGAWVKEEIGRQLCRFFPALSERVLNTDMRRWANFQNWTLHNIPIRRFYNCDILPKSLNEEFDYFFAGSDQIWNYRFKQFKPDDYFLTFAEHSKRVSISASFGMESISQEKSDFYKKNLSGFKYISVREKTGAYIVKTLIGRDVPVLIDPVMMLEHEEWLKILKKPRIDCSKPFILKYCLGDTDTKKLDQWASENNYLVYNLLDKNNQSLYSAGPGEFLTLIEKASLIYTDSFHCVAFSIIFHKPFLVLERGGKENYITSRLDTILETFGFQDRWANSLSEEDYLKCDYKEVDNILLSERKKALDYINEVLFDHDTAS